MTRSRARWVALAISMTFLSFPLPGQGGDATLERPLVLRWDCGGTCDPVFAGDEIIIQRSRALRGLAGLEHPGVAVWDPSSAAWYASANGVLVRLEEGGGLPVVADGIQGTDLDVRQAAGRAVSREPDRGIVLHDLAMEGGHKVLLSGQGFFHPRFDSTGDRILVHESRAAGGRVWLIEVETAEARVLVDGYAAAWHPDGDRVVFSRIRHDGERVTAADLWEVDLTAGLERRLAGTLGIAEVEAAVSPDGGWITYRDALSDTLRWARYPDSTGGTP